MHMGDTLRAYDSSVVQDSNSAVLARTDSCSFFFYLAIFKLAAIVYLFYTYVKARKLGKKIRTSGGIFERFILIKHEYVE